MPDLYAIGDVHGESGLLADLLGQIHAVAAEEDRLLFLGDYVDRGTDSKGVIDLILREKERRPGRVICLEGNHDEAMMEAIRNPSPFWLEVMEGWATVESYAPGTAALCKPTGGRLSPSEPALERALATLDRALPSTHREFFRSLAQKHEEPGLLFTHAGVDPSKELEAQSKVDYLWNEAIHLVGKWHGPPTLVIGHLPTYKLGPAWAGKPMVSEALVLVDTGSQRSGILSAVRFPDRRIFQARRLP